MRIFVGYGYHDRDQWIEDLVFDLIRAFRFEPVSGREIFGRELSEGVRQTIERSHAVLGFTTIRQDPQGLTKETHRWVVEELATASNFRIPLVEVREKGLDQGGMQGSRQYIVYEEPRRDACLVEIAKVLGTWRQNLPVRVKLIPDELINRQISPNLAKPGFRCTYKVLEGINEGPPRETRLLRIKGGLFVELRDLNPDSLVSVSIEYSGQTWSSGYENVDVASIELQP